MKIFETIGKCSTKQGKNVKRIKGKTESYEFLITNLYIFNRKTM